ncbi:MAG: cyclic nucleotide-binding domain-containing protein [Candidatus Eremiobacteraeota bacterium]|nr:cyclic nucleotide-binding domain-containing protein [Candidatus Eremiobacteraeota bacterium]
MEEKDKERFRILLGHIGFLPFINEKRFEELIMVAEKRSFSKGEVMIKKDSLDDSFYIISRGSCEAFVEEGEDEIKSVGTMSADNFFGEIALVMEGVRTAWVAAKETVDVFVISKQNVSKYLLSIPEIAEKIFATARKRLIS